MNELVFFNNGNFMKAEVVTTSLLVAEVFGKEHKHVLSDIRNLEKRIGDEFRPKLSEQRDSYGRRRPYYELTKSEALLIILKCNTKEKATVAKTIIKKVSSLEEIWKALENFEIPGDLPDMFVYAIREKDTGNIKLGISKSPQERLRQLQTGNSSELELVAYRRAENRYMDEKEQHKLNSDFHINGEWFDSRAVLQEEK